MNDARRAFRGAKLMLFAGDDLLVIRRDDLPGLEWAGYLDLPGGLREPGETPEACVLRELREELGLDLPVELLRVALIRHAPKGVEWFFAAHGPADLVDRVRFGDEGQGWKPMRPEGFVEAEDAIPHFRVILGNYLRTI
ncbi:NUDIX domain-containing protein [Sagittula sp. S175]|uniref:NUDIX domain-containing protein n=1 Tax=Sagittula sp. S175 TaxID=3415129 RepID=UPI003C7BF295